MKSYRQFDAQAYWANKPLCSICKKHKVKNGTICYQCKKEAIKQENIAGAAVVDPPIINPLPIKAIENMDTEKKGEGQKISQIKFDENFIKKLLDKLKVGNARSIHLNAVPGRSATRLDLCNLGSVDSAIPSDFVETILNNESFSFPISYDRVDLGKIDEEEKRKLALISKRLNTIVIENEDNFLEFGLKNFGFGYPLLIKRDRKDPAKIIKAPIFIWQLDIQRSYQNKNNWTIRKEEDSPIKINELLISHLSKDESINIEKLSEEVLEDGILDKKEVEELVEKILSQLNSKTDNVELRVEGCPSSQEIEDIANSKAWIQWSGIFGIYRSQNETIIRATEELLERIDEFKLKKLILEPFQTSTISAVETDPSKEEIINTLTKDEIKLIQGPPGTGKSQSITAIISNALANNAKCLIVCEKKTALDVIQANLEKLGLDDFTVLIDDVNKDRRKTIVKAREIKEENEYLGINPFSKTSFEENYRKFCRLKQEINARHAEALKKVFGDFSWKDLIGLYLRFSKSDDIGRLCQKLDYRNLEFNHEEYTKYLSVVEDGSYLFNELNRNSASYFCLVNDSVFADEYKWATHEKLKDGLAEFHDHVNDLCVYLSRKQQEDCEKRGVTLFAPESLEKCHSAALEILKELENIIGLHETGSSLGGDKFDVKSPLQDLVFNIASIFSSQAKEICVTRKNISLAWCSACDSIAEIKAYNFDELETLPFQEYATYGELKEASIELLTKVKEIETKLRSIMDIERRLKQAEADLVKMEKSGLFRFESFDYIKFGSYDALNEYCKDLQGKVEGAITNLDSYESFHNWMYFCSRRNQLEGKVLSVLEELPAKDWKELFSAWYYRGALIDHEGKNTIGFHKTDHKLKQLALIYEELGEEQVRQIRSIWNYKRHEEISETSFNFNTLYNLRKNNAGPKNSLRQIIAKDFDLFTTLFQVILTNPAAANAILPLEQGLFNVIFFDEASQLRISDTFTSLIRGQYKIIAGDEHQMPPSSYFRSSSAVLDDEDYEEEEFTEEMEQSVLAEAESLLQYAGDLKDINKSYLDFHYRSNHPALIEFSNCAFYGGNLVPFPAQQVYKPIELIPVNGRYETRTNPAEVVEVLRIIRDEIHPDQSGKCPSVGIATFNINQRNLIKEALGEASESSPEFARKYQELVDRGLFVKNLENIQGDEKDIIIISTTYGIKPDGTFSQNFARLNRIEGYKLLNVLITRAKHKLYVCTSIPREKYLSYAEAIQAEGNNKKGILYAYLAYAEAVSNQDNECAENILKLLKSQSFEKPRVIANSDGLSESPFEEEVYDSLVDRFGKDKIIQQHKVGGFRLDFIVKTGIKDIVLECDGKAYHSSEEAYAHDMYRQKELEKMGYIVYRIWSSNWFRDKEGEINKLLRFIESLHK